MLHPDTELRKINTRIGYGVVATALIPKGTITWVLDVLDQRYLPADVEKIPQKYQDILEKYSYLNSKGEKILCWDFAKYMNHSCNPNTLSPGYDFEIALRDIQAGEQLLCDYGSLNIESELNCLCKSKECRKTIKTQDFELYAKVWDEKISKAFPLIKEVPQALWKWVNEKDEIEVALKNPKELPSILRHRWYGDASKIRTMIKK